VGASSALFVAGYLLQALSGLVDALNPARIASPLYHANGTVPINNGVPVRHHALLAAVCALLAVLAVRLFERRDVGS
jgi:hypothetical protein